MRKFWLISLIVLCSFVEAVAGGRGGHRQAFDVNLLGGGWTCFRTQASGACGTGTFSQYFDASCSGAAGTTTDSAARDAWNTYAAANTPARLYIPSGSDCWFNTDAGLGFGQNGVIWGYGARVHGVRAIASNGYINDTSHFVKVQSVSAGASCVTAVNTSDPNLANLSVNTWVSMTGDSLQISSEPPNHQYQEYVYITSKNTGVVCFASPLRNSYLSTWPEIPFGGGASCDSQPCGGPAALFGVDSTWNTVYQLYGLKFLDAGTDCGDGSGQMVIRGRSGALYDISFDCATNPSVTVADNILIVGMKANSSEFDKAIGNLTLLNSSGTIAIIQNSAGGNLTMIGNRWSSINGTTANITLINTAASGIYLGPTSFGVGNSIVSDGSLIPTINTNNHSVPASAFSFSSGVLSVANSNANNAGSNAWGVGVPGHVYYFGDSDGTNNSSPLTYFTISAITQDATNTYWTLSNCSWGACTGALPTPTCNGHSCPTYVAYPAPSIIQRNRPAGAADMTVWQSP